MTQSFSLETKEYKAFGFDLGEGVPRRHLWLGVLIFALWVGLLTLIFGLPTKGTSIFYFTFPMFFVFYAFLPAKGFERRMNLTVWLLRLRFILFGHVGLCNRKPIVNRSDRLPLGERTDVWKRFMGFLGRSKADPWQVPDVQVIEIDVNKRPQVFHHVCVLRAEKRNSDEAF